MIDTSILFAFPYSDVPHNGMAVVATTDNDPALAEQICDELGTEIIRRHREFWPEMMTVEEAVHAAMSEPTGPVVLADYGDNPGGGSSCDGTAILWGSARPRRAGRGGRSHLRSRGGGDRASRRAREPRSRSSSAASATNGTAHRSRSTPRFCAYSTAIMSTKDR